MAQRSVTTSTSAGALGRQSGSLRQYLSNVFFVMAMGLLLTGAIALWISSDEARMASFFHLVQYVEDGETKQTWGASSWWYAAVVGELVLVIFLSWFGLASRLGTVAAITFFTLFAALNGLTLAPVLYAYTTASVVKVFFIAAAMFGTCALWGHTTKRDLTRFGSFFLTALVGLLAALVVNMFLGSPMLDFGISAFAVLLFAGLIAYDMQMLEAIYEEEGGTYTPGTVVFGALSLYLDFINLFLHLLRLFGIRKD